MADISLSSGILTEERHAIDSYLPKLVRAGFKVAVCDQLEDPKLAKKLVKRGITELVTPGVAYNDQLLQQKENNYLAGAFFDKNKGGLAFLDISTGTFKIAEGSLEYVDMVSPKQTEMTIVAEAAEKEQKDALKNEIRQLMRTRRHLKPMQKDNFSVSELSMLIKEVDGIMGIVNIVGWIIGGFSLLIGGFGIANIMFVSVKERTNQIGVQKALGAQKEFILGEFLFEAVFLSLIGGIVGILLVYVVSLFVPKGVLDIVLTGSNILEGLGISLAVGLISGFLPAKSAADLDPVIAINS